MRILVPAGNSSTSTSTSTTQQKLPPRPVARPPLDREASRLRARLLEDGFDPNPPRPRDDQPSTTNVDVGIHYADPGKDHELFSAGGDLGDDLQQGQLGDCGLVATVAELAHRNPDLLRQAIYQGSDGKVSVRLYDRVDPNDPTKGFVPRLIPLDVKLPMNVFGSWSYGHTRDGDLFFPLIEKAFAKRAGGYGKLEGIYPSEVMEALMGTGTNTEFEWFDQKTPGQVLDTVRSLYDKGEMLVLHSQSDEKKLSNNIVHSHAYSVEGIVQKNGKTYIEVRNPWGFMEPGSWRGPDDGKDDGRFLISPENLKKWFTGVSHDSPMAPPAPGDDDVPQRRGGRGFID